MVGNMRALLKLTGRRLTTTSGVGSTGQKGRGTGQLRCRAWSAVMAMRGQFGGNMQLTSNLSFRPVRVMSLTAFSVGYGCRRNNGRNT